MLIYNFIFEKFTFKPRNVKLFFENLGKRIIQYENEITSYYENINQLLEADDSYERRDKEYYFENAISYSFDDFKYQIKNFKKTIDKNNEHLSNRIQYLFSLAKSNPRGADFLRYIIHDLKYFQEDMKYFYEFSKNILENLDDIKLKLEDRDYVYHKIFIL